MSNETITPTLTLEPNEVQTPELTLNTQVEQPKPIETPSLTPEERTMIDGFVKQIDITNTNLVMQYGAGAQKKIADFSDDAIANVKGKDLGEVGAMLGSMVTELKNFEIDEEEEKGFFGFFKKQKNKLEIMKTKYATAETNINAICQVLEGHQIQLLKDVAVLDKMYEINTAYFKELSMYILAGKEKINLVKTVELPAAVAKSQASGLPEDAQAANDMANMLNRFEKKIHDLELTRTISMQMAPQIRLVQNNDTLMAEKIQSSLVNTIPLWKSQMVIALGVANATEAAKAQRGVTDMTNDLLKKNAEALKMNTIEAAKESERGIVDIETLKATNASLISTFDEVLQIQQTGRQKRMEAEVEMAKIESELKQKLLEVSQQHVQV